MKSIASLSLDLDNQWSYMKTHGDAGWESFPSYLDIVVPRVLRFLEDFKQTITFFIVGQDAALEKNHTALRHWLLPDMKSAIIRFTTNLGCIYTRSNKSPMKSHRPKNISNARRDAVRRAFAAQVLAVPKRYCES